MTHAHINRSRVSPGVRVPPRLMLKPRPIRHHHGKVGSPEGDETARGYKMDALYVSIPENASSLSSCHGFSASKITHPQLPRPTNPSTSEPATWTIHQSTTPMSTRITRPHRHVARHGPGSCMLHVQSLVPSAANLQVRGRRGMAATDRTAHPNMSCSTYSIYSYEYVP